MERSLTLVLACGRILAAHDDERVLRDDDLDRISRHARQVHHELDAGGGLEDIDAPCTRPPRGG